MSFFGIVFRRLTAWRMRHAAAAELTILEARRRVAEARKLTEEAEADVELRQALNAAPGEQAVQLLAPQTEVQRLLLQHEQLRRQRLYQALPSPTLADPSPTLEWELSDREIETLAVKAVSQFGAMGPVEAQRAWQEWRQELERRLPPYAAAEVIRRAHALQLMAR
jgi:hypothetical protein